MEKPLNGKKVLIVEDERPMLDALAEKFGTEGANVVTAEDGTAAVSLAEREKPDLILLDILMPGMNGMEALDSIRNGSEWGKKVPIIMLTNLSADDKIMQNVTKNEPSYYLVKTDWKLFEVIEKAKSCLGIQ
jgi:DNA-binding response OmpR family regulator